MRATYQFHISELNNKFIAYLQSLFKNREIKIIISDEISSEKNDNNDELEEWYSLSKKSLEKAYTAEEPEYNMDMLKEPNPEYERR